jgi:hypothetical protein
VHLSKKEKAKDLVAISGEIVEWGFKPSRFPGMYKTFFFHLFVFLDLG